MDITFLEEMKKLKFILVFIAVACQSCSQDEAAAEDALDTAHYYTFSRENRPVDLGVFTAIRTEHGFKVAKAGFPSDWYFTFDDQGRFGKIYFKFTPLGYTNQVVRQSYPEFSSNYFDFNLESIDEVNKRVKFSFNGTIYQFLDNLDFERNEVSGEFDLYYIDNIALISGLTNEALIDGDSWRQVSFVRTISGNNILVDSKSDDAYKIFISFNATTAPGTYAFNPSSTTNRVYLAKFNTETRTYTTYQTTGSMEVTSKTPLDTNWFTWIGNYSFTAVNPNDSNDVIQVNNGVFKVY